MLTLLQLTMPAQEWNASWSASSAVGHAQVVFACDCIPQYLPSMRWISNASMHASTRLCHMYWGRQQQYSLMLKSQTLHACRYVCAGTLSIGAKTAVCISNTYTTYLCAGKYTVTSPERTSTNRQSPARVPTAMWSNDSPSAIAKPAGLEHITLSLQLYSREPHEALLSTIKGQRSVMKGST